MLLSESRTRTLAHETGYFTVTSTEMEFSSAENLVFLESCIQEMYDQNSTLVGLSYVKVKGVDKFFGTLELDFLVGDYSKDEIAYS